MSTTSYTDPAFDALTARVRTAMRSEVSAVEPADAWVAIVDRLEAPGRRVPWWLWLRHRPVLLGAAAALVAAVVLLTVNLVGGDEDAENVDITDTPTTAPSGVAIDPEAGPVVGARADGSLALLDATTGEVADSLVTAEGFEGGLRPPDGGGDASLLRELAVSPDGTTVYQARPENLGGIACEGTTFAADWAVWEIDIAEHEASAGPAYTTAQPGVTQAWPPARMPVISPDGTMLAFLTTSSYEACDDALMVAVTDLDGLGDLGLGLIVATHTLPVGVMPTQLVWATDDQLTIVLPTAEGAAPEGLLPAAVDPLVSGPVSMQPASALLPGSELAPTGDGGLLLLHGGGAGPGPSVDRVESLDAEVAGGVRLFTVPDPAGPDVLTQDGRGAVWTVTAASSDEPRTYRWAPDDDQEEAVHVAEGFVAVAASPFVGRTPASDGTSTTSEPASGQPPTTGATFDDAVPGFLYVSQDGRLYERESGDESSFGSLVADGLASPRPTSPLGHTIAVEPDGGHAYVTRWPDGADLCRGEVLRVGLPGSSDADVGADDVIVDYAADPALNVDGTKLAFIATEPDPASPDRCRSTIVVRDLESGGELRWPEPSTEEVHRYQWSHPVWLTDTQLAFQWTDTTAGSHQVFVLDTSQEEVEILDAAVRFGALGDAQLLGVWDGSLVYWGWCPANARCLQPGDVSVRVDEGDSPPPDILEPEGFIDGVWGDPGLLARSSAACPDTELCAGYDLVWSPIGGDPRPIPLEPKVHAAAWLP